jgi:hypothetical protein
MIRYFFKISLILFYCAKDFYIFRMLTIQIKTIAS